MLSTIYKKKKILNYIKIVVLIFFCIVVFKKCVPEVPPPGGPEDKKPPVLIENKSYPINETVNFSKKKLIFAFDKKIKLNNVYDQIKIIPSLQKGKSKYGYTYKFRNNNKLIIYLNHDLKKDTEYTINFGNAITSLDGNVPLKNLTIVFSTGPKLHSLFIKGIVTNILTGEPLKDMYVSLYEVNRNENITNGTPNYFTKTDDKGNFELKNLKKQKYIIYASDKVNFDNEHEDIEISTFGYLSERIDLKKNESVIIHAIMKNIAPLKIKKIKNEQKYISINFNKPIKDYTIGILEKFKIFENTPKVCSLLSEDKKTIKIFNCFYEKESSNNFLKVAYLLEEDKKIQALVYAKDDMSNEITENISLHFGKDVFNIENSLLKITPTNTEYLNSQKDKIEITAEKPIKNLDITKCYFTLESAEKIYISRNSIKFDKFDNKLILQVSLPKNIGKIINLTLEEGFLEFIDRSMSKKSNIFYKVKSYSNTGTIKGKQYLGIENVIIQLLDKQFNIIDEVINVEEYEFSKIPEGEYTIRILGLLQNKKEWFSGNIKTLEAYDPIYLYHPKNGFIKIKSGIKRTLKTFVSKI